MSEVLVAVLPDRQPAVLSGPTFASEVARNLPTAVTLACEDAAVAEALSESLATPYFRPYAAADVTGVEIAGATKNVIAIACGVAMGRGLGENARASLITRGLAEMQRLVLAKGGSAPTLMGLGGVGDLALTCSTEQSRNFAFGVLIGRGMPVADALSRPDIVVEGVHTARAVPKLARSLGVEMPICEAVATVLHENGDIDEAMQSLLSRPLRREAG
jgi:glycerol-3-phosphate dehydrogenase (NAD(P)+)